MDIVAIIDAVTKFGIENVWKVIGIAAVITIIKQSFNPEVAKSLNKLDTTLKDFSNQLGNNTRAVEQDNKIFERLAYLESKVVLFEGTIKRNLIVSLRLIFKNLNINHMCIGNPGHDKAFCPFRGNVFCEEIDRIKYKIKSELDPYIIDEIVKDKLHRSIESYVQPGEPIEKYVREMLEELENIIK